MDKQDKVLKFLRDQGDTASSYLADLIEDYRNSLEGSFAKVTVEACRDMQESIKGLLDNWKSI